MPNKRVLITGATGFVGCRLAERLALGSDYQVRALIHRFSGPGLARLCRLPVTLVNADILDPAAVLEAADGCSTIIHLAYGRAGTKDQRREIGVVCTNFVPGRQHVGQVVTARDLPQNQNSSQQRQTSHTGNGQCHACPTACVFTRLPETDQQK